MRMALAADFECAPKARYMFVDTRNWLRLAW